MFMNEICKFLCLSKTLKVGSCISRFFIFIRVCMFVVKLRLTDPNGTNAAILRY